MQGAAEKANILHIMRYYHPKRVYLFLSQQIADLEAQDHRFEKTFQHMQEVCAAQGIVYQDILASGDNSA